MSNTTTTTRIKSILSSGITVDGKLKIGSFVTTKHGLRKVVGHVKSTSTVIL